MGLVLKRLASPFPTVLLGVQAIFIAGWFGTGLEAPVWVALLPAIFAATIVVMAYMVVGILMLGDWIDRALS